MPYLLEDNIECWFKKKNNYFLFFNFTVEYIFSPYVIYCGLNKDAHSTI